MMMGCWELSLTRAGHFGGPAETVHAFRSLKGCQLRSTTRTGTWEYGRGVQGIVTRGDPNGREHPHLPNCSTTLAFYACIVLVPLRRMCSTVAKRPAMLCRAMLLTQIAA